MLCIVISRAVFFKQVKMVVFLLIIMVHGFEFWLQIGCFDPSFRLFL